MPKKKYHKRQTAPLLILLGVLGILGGGAFLAYRSGNLSSAADAKTGCSNIATARAYIQDTNHQDPVTRVNVDGQEVKIRSDLKEEWSTVNFVLQPTKWWQFWLKTKGVVVKHVVTNQPTLAKDQAGQIKKESLPASFAVYEYEIKTLGKKGQVISFQDALGQYFKNHKSEIQKTIANQGYAIDSIDQYLDAANLRNLAQLVGETTVDQWLDGGLKIYSSRNDRVLKWHLSGHKLNASAWIQCRTNNPNAQ